MEPKQEKIVNFECQQGDSVFCKPFIFALSDATVKQLKQEVDDALQHVLSLKDDRLLALVSELLVENAIEKYLLAIMPRYEIDLRPLEKCGFDFSLRIAVSRALGLSPSKLFDCADAVRRVRNDFAHNLNIKCFSDLSLKRQNEINKAIACYGNVTPKGQSMPDKFKALTLLTIVGLGVYTKHVQLMSTFFKDELFIKSINDFSTKVPAKG